MLDARSCVLAAYRELKRDGASRFRTTAPAGSRRARGDAHGRNEAPASSRVTVARNLCDALRVSVHSLGSQSQFTVSFDISVLSSEFFVPLSPPPSAGVLPAACISESSLTRSSETPRR